MKEWEQMEALKEEKQLLENKIAACTSIKKSLAVIREARLTAAVEDEAAKDIEAVMSMVARLEKPS